MKNNFDVVKNYGYEDEEIVFNSDDYNECVRLCKELHEKAGKYEFFAVYPSDAMMAGSIELTEQEFDKVVDLLENPPPTSEKLLDAAEKMKDNGKVEVYLKLLEDIKTLQVKSKEIYREICVDVGRCHLCDNSHWPHCKD